MQKQLVATILIVFMPFLFVSCVSSILKDKPPTFSSEITLKDPSSPFTRTRTSVFPSWKSSQSGNVISIVSDCNENSPATLSSLHQLIESSLESPQIISEENITIQDRPSLLKVVNAQLDGYPIEVRSVSFRKKSCGYVSSLSGKKGTLEADRASFEQFLNNLSFK
ncbi:hypothetical protein [Pseudobdellovibrio exovorus]|uniref:Uncharacterized protein n=1 Tax=Pseudobdellovibrio exovorus JSS TaxID=1184267 RepID=M4VAW7_9BACT|nr:hypothetical protein [Pseudobdellovibrio exovorus]AGH96368.1 hypothetical protein A11Q_2152 [Pseudobdellovibrio exovorus JSS]